MPEQDPAAYHEQPEVVTFNPETGRYFWGLDIPGTDRRVCGTADTADEAWQLIREYKAAGDLPLNYATRTRRGGVDS